MNFQIALIAVGVVLVLVVYLVTRWRERLSNSVEHKLDSYRSGDGTTVNPIFSHKVQNDQGADWSLQSVTDVEHDIERQADDHQATADTHDLIEPSTVSYSGGYYSFQIPSRDDDLKWTDAISLIDDSTESNEIDNEPESALKSVSPSVVETGFSGKYHYPDIHGFDRISQIDYWVRLHGESDVGRESVLAQFRESRSSLTKENRLLGFKVGQESWCDLEYESEDARFDDIIITLQLADQTGAVSESELGQFLNLVANLSNGTNRRFAFMASPESALEQANAIVDFIRHYESMFVINIKPQGEDLSVHDIERYATQLGLERVKNNYFVRNKIKGKAGVCLYSLVNMNDSGEFDFDTLGAVSTHGVTFFTKPAVNLSPGAVFSEMADTAKIFAGRVNGEVVSPNHEVLSDEVVEQIRQSIEQVSLDMAKLGIAPGSDEAIRIFS